MMDTHPPLGLFEQSIIGMLGVYVLAGERDIGKIIKGTVASVVAVQLYRGVRHWMAA